MRIHYEIIHSTFEFACAFHHIFLSKNVKHWFHYPVSIIGTQLSEFEGSKMGHRRIYQFYSDVRQCHLFKKRGSSVILFKSRLCIQRLQSKQLLDTHSLPWGSPEQTGLWWDTVESLATLTKVNVSTPPSPPTPWYPGSLVSPLFHRNSTLCMR